MSEILLSVENLSISYRNSENIVVNNFSVTLEAGKVLAIVGESGCGKTSLIRGIMGILPPSGEVVEGNITFDGVPLLKNKKFKKGKEIAFIFQNSGSMLNPVVTIGKQFIEYIRTHEKMSKSKARELAIQCLEKVQLNHAEQLLERYAFQLSGGMQQRVGIAMAICFHPKLILADEPTSALDVTTQIQVLDLLKNINKEYGCSLVFVTHNLGAASYLAHDCMVMYQGNVVEHRSMKEVISQPEHPYTQKLIQSTVLEEDFS